MTDEATFENTYARLQEVVTKLERGDLGLEATTVLYGEGLELTKKCRDLLQATERKVRHIQQNEAVPDAENGIKQSPSN